MIAKAYPAAVLTNEFLEDILGDHVAIEGTMIRREPLVGDDLHLDRDDAVHIGIRETNDITRLKENGVN